MPTFEMLPFAAASLALLAYLCASARVCPEALRGVGGVLPLRAGGLLLRPALGGGLTALTALLDQISSEVQSIHPLSSLLSPSLSSPLSPSVEPMALSSEETSAVEPMALYAELAVRVSSASNSCYSLIQRPREAHPSSTQSQY